MKVYISLPITGHDIEEVEASCIYAKAVLEAASALGQIGKSVKYGELKKFKSVSNVAHQLREMTKKLSSPIYGLEDAALACGNSDFIKECVTLIATRCGDDGESKQKLIAAIREATA